MQVLQELRVATSAFTASQMQITPEQGQFMAMLVKLTGAQNYLEIGVFTGYSLISTALALPSGGKAVALDRDPRALEVARQFVQQAGLCSKVDIREGPAMESLEAVSKEYGHEHFDLVFIGALLFVAQSTNIVNCVPDESTPMDNMCQILYSDSAVQMLTRGAIRSTTRGLWNLCALAG